MDENKKEKERDTSDVTNGSGASQRQEPFLSQLRALTHADVSVLFVFYMPLHCPLSTLLLFNKMGNCISVF